MIDCHVLL